MELGSVAEIAAVVVPIVASCGAVIWWVARTKSTLDDHDKRINHLETDTGSEIAALRKDIQDLRFEMIKGFAKQGIEIATKQEKE